jgi:hypothetical protein
MSDLLSCTTKLDEPRVLYVCCPHHGNCEGWWSDLFNGSHLRVCLLTCFIHVLSVWSHTKDDMLYSRWTCNWLWCLHVYHTCAFHMSNMRGKDTLHSNEGCPRLDAVHAAAWRLDTISIVNGNVCVMRTSPVHLHQQHLHSRHHLQGQSLGLVQESWITSWC